MEESKKGKELGLNERNKKSKQRFDWKFYTWLIKLWLIISLINISGFKKGVALHQSLGSVLHEI
jgi:hypothetical protein